MKLIAVFSFILTFSFAYTQQKIEIQSQASIDISQKHGRTISDKPYTLEIFIQNDTFSYRTRTNQDLSRSIIKKRTEKYFVSENSYGYSFFDVINERLFTIMYFNSRYFVSAYGKGYSAMKETSNKMMEMLKNGKSQRDVVNYLVEQAEYDF